MFNPKSFTEPLLVRVVHPQIPGAEFIFSFEREQSTKAREEEDRYIGLSDDERKGAHDEEVVRLVGMMSTEPPSNVEGFPDVATVRSDVLGDNSLSHELVDRFAAYYHSMPKAAQRVFADICASAWLAYRLSFQANAQVFLRRDSSSGDTNGLPRRRAKQALA